MPDGELETANPAPDAPENGAPAESGVAAPEKPREQALEEELQEQKDKYLRMLAETENFKKRLAREREDERSYAAQEAVLAVLPVADNLDRTVQAAKPAVAAGEGGPVLANLVKGTELTLKQFEDVLRRLGVESVPCELGRPFDPNLHQALFQEERADMEEGSIIEVMQKGYKISGRVIRPAMVKVSKKP